MALGTASREFSLPPAPPVAVEVVSDSAAFKALQQEWTALFERAARPEHLFQDFEWLACWADHYLQPGDELRLIVERREGRLTMVWPLVLVPFGMGLRKLVWMGAPVSQYGDALVEPGPHARASLEAGWRAALAQGADFILLRKTRCDANVALLLQSETRACEAAQAPFVEFAGRGDFARVLDKRSSKVNSSRRRLRRRLEETGKIVFSEARAEAVKPLAPQAFAMKRASLALRGLYSAPIEGAEMLRFFLDFPTRAGSQTQVLGHAIARDGTMIAVGVTLGCKGVGFGHLLTHEPACAKQGVGLLLAEHVLKSCFAMGFSRYDMLAPFDAYKAEWADGATDVADYVKGRGAIGAALATVWRSRARQKLKAALKGVSGKWGRLLWPLARAAFGGRP